MTTSFSNIDLEKLQLAIDVEIKYQYIDICGKKSCFSEFIISQLKIIYKNTQKAAHWLSLIEDFKHYKFETMPIRKKMIEKLLKAFREEYSQKKKKKTVAESSLPENSDVIYIKGVGPKVGAIFNKMGIFTALDLIQYYPKKYIDYSQRTKICNLKVGENVTVFGYIKSCSIYNTKNKKNLSIMKLQVEDETGAIVINFFWAKSSRAMIERYKAQFPVNKAIIISGTVKRDSFTGKPTLDKPSYQLAGADFEENQSLNLGRIVPVYPLVENLNAKTLRKAIYNAIEQYENQIENVLPQCVIEKYHLTNKNEAIKQIHFPDNMNSMENARYSLVFEELFLLQLKLILFRENNNKHLSAVPIKIAENGLVRKFIDNLPFELTNSQKKAVQEILADLNSGKPMQRLLQGDVGSGKTVVAVIMLLSAIENGYQTAIMAPTEILAQQHYNNMVEWLTPLGISCSLFKGTNTKKQRDEIEANLQNGQTHVAIGTHALIQENVHFKNLGAVVIDEQHRFGVNQRNKLRNKGLCPQVLTMSATPIPRTLALTVHGDMDITIINERPKGRLPIITTLIKSSAKRGAYDLIANEVENGHQAYIVYPLIEESETISAKAATAEWEKLSQKVFPQYKIGLLHGKLSADEKDEVMNDFKSGKYQILVSTTVVEVGVDVANATVIVIENAERFGLSQLHQLRGRVGRSSLQSYCVLVASTSNEQTAERLNVMTQTNDGFVIAEKDLQLRGPGDFLGTRQSGLPDLLITDLTKDLPILEEARKAATEYYNSQNFDEKDKLCKSLIEKVNN